MQTPLPALTGCASGSLLNSVRGDCKLLFQGVIVKTLTVFLKMAQANPSQPRLLAPIGVRGPCVPLGREDGDSVNLVLLEDLGMHRTWP